MIVPRLKFRAPWVTLLDIGLILSVAAGLVIALGGRARVDVAGFRVVLLSPTNFVIFAACFGALRILAGRGLRPLPAMAIPSRAAIDAERAICCCLSASNHTM